LAGKDHWDQREGGAKPRCPKAHGAVGDLLALIDPLVVPEAVFGDWMRAWKILAVVCSGEQARACGVEYAENSHRMTAQLFAHANATPTSEKRFYADQLRAPVRLTWSTVFGVVEHFTDRARWSEHVEMLKPGGTRSSRSLISEGLRLAGTTHGRENYEQHNVSIMSERAMLNLAPGSRAGKIVCLWPPLAMAVAMGQISSTPIDAGLLRPECRCALAPLEIKPLCPWLVLEITRPGPSI